MGTLRKLEWDETKWQEFENKLIIKSFGPFSFTYTKQGLLIIALLDDIVIQKSTVDKDTAMRMSENFIRGIGRGKKRNENTRRCKTKVGAKKC